MAVFSRHATLAWTEDAAPHTAHVSAGTGAFRVAASGPRLAGEPEGVTTPEEMLAASHAICYGIGLRSLIAQQGGRASRVEVTATITATKDARGIRLQGSHLQARVHGLEGLDAARLPELALATEQGCTISNALRAAVHITFDVTAA